MNLCSLQSRASALSLALAAAFPCSSLAQTPALKETVVTATRFPEEARWLPFGVSVITAEEIRNSGAVTVNDAIVRLLGVIGRTDLFGGGDTSIDLRGFGQTADSNQLVVLDGQRLSEADLSSPRLAGIPIESIERIEVLRGSGAVLYGEGATGGVIVITTKAGAGKQRQGVGGTAYVSAGSFGLREARGSVSAAGQSGFALDANVSRRESDGWRANSHARNEAGSVTGQWSNEWLRAGVRAAQDTLDARLPGPLTAAQFAANPRQVDPLYADDRAHVRNDRTGVFAQADLGAWQLGLDAGHRTKHLNSLSAGFPFDSDVAANTWGVRALHVGEIADRRNQLTFGSDSADWKRTGFGQATMRSNGVYLRDELTLAGDTRLSAGAREERIRKADTGTGTRLDRNLHAWELGVSQPIGADTTAYARVGRSFRLANLDELTFTLNNAALRPQTSRDVELGARWKTDAASLEGRLWRSDLRDEIGLDPVAFANVNFDPTRRQGVEVDASRKLSSSVSLRVNAAVRSATFRSGAFVGSDVPLVPRRTLAVRADWTPAPGHRINAGAVWYGPQHPDLPNTCSMPSYTITDARYAWQLSPQVEIGLAVTNLLDRKYISYAFACLGTQPTSVYPEPGRAAVASVRFNF